MLYGRDAFTYFSGKYYWMVVVGMLGAVWDNRVFGVCEWALGGFKGNYMCVGGSIYADNH